MKTVKCILLIVFIMLVYRIAGIVLHVSISNHGCTTRVIDERLVVADDENVPGRAGECVQWHLNTSDYRSACQSVIWDDL